MSGPLGDFDTSAVVYGKFTTYRPSTGAPYTLAGSPVLSVYKDNSTTQSTTGVTLTVDFDSVTGLNHFAIDTSADGTFYAAGTFFDVVITTGTVDSVSAVGTTVGSFTLRKTSPLKPATAGRTIVVDASGLADANTVKVGPTGSGTAQTARDLGASVLLSSGTGTGQLDFTSGVVKANATQWLGGTIPAVNVTGVPLVDLKYALGTISPAAAGYVALDWGQVTNKTTTNALTGTTISTSQVAASVTAGVTVTTNNDKTGYGLDTDIRRNTAAGGAAGSITLDASASATDSLYNGSIVVIRSGAGAGQARLISGYTGSTKVATVVPDWTTNPDNTSVFTVMPKARADIALWLGSAVNSLISGRVDANAQVVGDKTAYSLSQSFPTNFSSMSIDSSGRLDVIKVNGTSQTARDLGASVLLSSGTGTGQLDFTSGVVKSNMTQVSGDANVPTHFKRAVLTTAIGTATTGGTTTSIPTSSLTPAAAVADQFKGRVVIFDKDTTTANLRGQAMPISASTSGGTLTLSSALTDAPASGDTFVIV